MVNMLISIDRLIDWSIHQNDANAPAKLAMNHQFIDLLIGWLIDWLLTGWLIDRLFVWLVDRLIGWSVDWSIDQCFNWLISANWTLRLIDRLVGVIWQWSIDGSTVWLIDWSIDRLIDWLALWVTLACKHIDWLISQSINTLCWEHTARFTYEQPM